jgi:hypothetical protein
MSLFWFTCASAISTSHRAHAGDVNTGNYDIGGSCPNKLIGSPYSYRLAMTALGRGGQKSNMSCTRSGTILQVILWGEAGEAGKAGINSGILVQVQ